MSLLEEGYECYREGVFVRRSAESTSFTLGNVVVAKDSQIAIDIKNGATVDIRNLKVNGAAFTTVGENSKVRGMNLQARGAGVQINIGSNFRCGNLLLVAQFGNVDIGDNVLFSHGITIRTSDMHSVFDTKTGERINPPQDVSVSDQVWIGQDVVIGKGARIGRDSIVAARAFVSGTVDENTLVGGTPARVIRRDVTWSRDDAP
ncbi:acyltransferase [Roseovarius indicus]|uniref:Galactoside O-acetyltransferase n=1 Tax=Roseovarius indicus TaxID=540747 RepID=A0A5P3AFQ3_9RHOB|nr:acyltransferase [Roseovarius indicus]QEW28207.1 Galactoside O-acetyltransferase [Roseovarius indicus]SFE56377.1 transferase hexapeptide (six repeat-containing protein) [Roseovarius indicus]